MKKREIGSTVEIQNPDLISTSNCGGGNIHRDFDLEIFLSLLYLL